MTKLFKVRPGVKSSAALRWEILMQGEHFAYVESLSQAYAEISCAVSLIEDGYLTLPAKATIGISVDYERVKQVMIDAIRDAFDQRARFG